MVLLAGSFTWRPRRLDARIAVLSRALHETLLEPLNDADVSALTRSVAISAPIDADQDHHQPSIPKHQVIHMRTLTTAIDLDATPDGVWSILTATHDYPQWNPFIRRLDGPLTPGSQLTMRIEPPGGKGMTFTPKVTHVEPGRRLAWLGSLGMPGLFDGAHSFTLEPLDDRHTRLVQSESFTGILVWFSGGLLKKTEAGFHAMNAALGERLTATVGSSEH